MAKELLKRSEVKVEDTWKIEDMYASIGMWEADYGKCSELCDKLAGYEGKVGESADSLCEVIDLIVECEYIIDKTVNYAARIYDCDTSDSESQALRAKAYALADRFSASISFFDPELMEIEDEKLEEFYTANEKLEFYRKFIEEVRRLKAYTLSKDCEKLMALASKTRRSPQQTYSLLDNADLTFGNIKDEKGEEVQLTHGRFISLLSNYDRSVRENVFKTYYASYKKLINTYGALLDGQVTQLIFKAQSRKYASTLEAAVLANNVPVQVYHNLVDTVNDMLPTLHRYVSLRKKCLKADELHMYDIYVPMIADAAKKVSFDEAKATVLKALKPLGEDYLDVLKEAFASRWIDIYENENKRSGAYSAGVYGVHPYVLLNYDDSLDNMFTLAHEMGHAMHSYYSNSKQPYVYSDYKIFVAEVASTCNEVLLLEYLLKNTTDKKEKAYLLNHYLDMFKGTLFRQTQFAEFEMKINEMGEKGEALNAQSLSDLYLELNKKYYGADMVSDDEIAYEWARIPHFYMNFYVYQYATSFAASIAIAHKILEGGPAEAANYREFLSGGCSKPPVELLKDAGVDMMTSQPIIDAIKVMDGVLDELEALVREL